MIPNRRSLTLSTLAIIAVVSMTGCTIMEESYAGRETDQVWTAMVAVANSPDYYHDWFITENHVWVDDEGARIEVQRTIERDLVRSGMNPQHQKKSWQHQILLLEDESGPLVRFTSRDWGVPIQAQEEAHLYFADVWELLGGKPDPAMTDDDDDGGGEDVDVDDVNE